MNNLKNNKAFQTVIGCGTLYLAFILWKDGWFEWLFNGRNDSEGFSNTQLWLAIGSAILSFVQLVGICTICIVSGVLPHVETMLTFAAKQIKKLAVVAKEFISKSKNRPPDDGESWDWRPLAAILLSWALWSGGQLSSIWETIVNVLPDAVDVISDKPAAILFSVSPETATDGQLAVSSSLVVEDLLQANGVERRMYSGDQSQEFAEPWVGSAMDAAPDAENVMVLYYPNGSIELADIPTSVEQMERLANGW